MIEENVRNKWICLQFMEFCIVVGNFFFITLYQIARRRRHNTK